MGRKRRFLIGYSRVVWLSNHFLCNSQLRNPTKLSGFSNLNSWNISLLPRVRTVFSCLTRSFLNCPEELSGMQCQVSYLGVSHWWTPYRKVAPKSFGNFQWNAFSTELFRGKRALNQFRQFQFTYFIPFLQVGTVWLPNPLKTALKLPMKYGSELFI